MDPKTITEREGRFVIHNARPKAMRVLIGVVAPIILALLVKTMIDDVETANWIMVPVRAGFGLVVVLAAVFSLFGDESVGLEGGELVWRRGKSLERKCAVGEVEAVERQGNQLWVRVRGEKHPIIVGAGLRQPEAAVEWLRLKLDAALQRARKA